MHSQGSLKWKYNKEKHFLQTKAVVKAHLWKQSLGRLLDQPGSGWITLVSHFSRQAHLGFASLPVLTWGISSPLWEKKQNWKWWQEVFAGELLPHYSIPDRKEKGTRAFNALKKGRGLSRKDIWSRKPSVKGSCPLCDLSWLRTCFWEGRCWGCGLGHTRSSTAPPTVLHYVVGDRMQGDPWHKHMVDA